jgi:hypothetical protein
MRSAKNQRNRGNSSWKPSRSKTEAALCRVLIRSIVSTSLQEGQWKTSSSGSTPSFGIVRTSSIASPQERHANVGGLSGIIGGERSITGLEGVCFGMRDSLKQAGVLPNSQPPTPGTGPLSVMKYT